MFTLMSYLLQSIINDYFTIVLPLFPNVTSTGFIIKDLYKLIACKLLHISFKFIRSIKKQKSIGPFILYCLFNKPPGLNMNVGGNKIQNKIVFVVGKFYCRVRVCESQVAVKYNKTMLYTSAQHSIK